MADPTRPLTPAPDDSWPAPDDAAVRRLVEALTADAPPEELSDEARYIAAFTTLTAPAEPAAAPGRRRGRLVLVAAAAALAATGTPPARARGARRGARRDRDDGLADRSSAPPCALLDDVRAEPRATAVRAGRHD